MATQTRNRLSRVQKHVQKHGILQVARQIARSEQEGVDIHTFAIQDGYHQPWYRLERFGSRLLAGQMEAYLAKRHHIDFNHPKNGARKLLYTLPSFPEWATLMPGALALEPIHHPEQKRLPTGKRVDPITRRLFRHGMDPVGVRTRTLMGGWIAYNYVKARSGQPISWLSLAGGTAAPSMLMVNASEVDKNLLTYADIDIDPHAIRIAGEIVEFEGLSPDKTTLLAGDIFDEALLSKATGSGGVDIIDMMGIFEYLDVDQAVKLLKLAYDKLKPGGIIIAGNMRAEHPQLNLHKRGVGWPDVIPRKVDDLLVIFNKAEINKSNLTIYQPKDGVYNVLSVRKP